jgi:hypothetical protein
MPKPKLPIPSITHLRLLIALYGKLRKIPPYPDLTTEPQFVDSLQKALNRDGIVKQSSRNFIYKIIGMPYQSPDDDEGVSTLKLDAIAKVVIEGFAMEDKFNIQPNETIYWGKFVQFSFVVPDYLGSIQAKKYYKFLDPYQRGLVDEFVNQQMEFLLGNKREVHTYSVYVWSGRSFQVVTGILQLNLKKSYAIYTYQTSSNGILTNRITARTDVSGGAFKISDGAVFLNFVEQNPQKDNIRLNFIISARDLDFTSLPMLKAVLSTAADNGHTPVTSLVMLEKRRDLLDAERLVHDPSLLNEHLCFDVMNKRMVIEESGFNTSSINSWKTFDVLTEIRGAYAVVFKTLTNAHGNKGNIGISFCFIEGNGLVSFNSHAQFKLRCYVSQEYVGSDFICISHFEDDGKEKLKFDYKLRILRDESKEVTMLSGSYSTIYRQEEELSGDTVFLKLNFANKGDLMTQTKATSINLKKPVPDGYREILKGVWPELLRRDRERQMNLLPDFDTLL